MAYGCSFAGVRFALDTEEVEALIERFIPFRDLRQTLSHRAPRSRNLDGIAAPYWPARHDLKLGQFFYPTGAARWAEFNSLMDTASVTLIKQTAYESSSAPVRAPFSLIADCEPPPDAASAGGITTDLYLLPPKPLSSLGGPANGLWLITLVDERYFWQYRNAGLRHITGSDTWTGLLTTVASALGITLAQGSIDAGFGNPAEDSQLYSNHENAAVYLDALAANVGKLVVRNLDGTYKLETPVEAQAASEGNRSVAARMAGDRALDGLNQSGPILPSTVTVTFPRFVTDGDFVDPRDPRDWITPSYGDVYVKVVNPGDAGLPTSFLPHVGTHVIRDTARAYYVTEGSSTPTNQSSLDTLAVLLGTFYYRCQLAGTDDIYPGIRAWTPEGANDLLFTYRQRYSSTRAQRKPYNWHFTDFQHRFGDPGSNPPSGGACPLTVRDTTPTTVTDVCTLTCTEPNLFVVAGGANEAILTARLRVEDTQGSGTDAVIVIQFDYGDFLVTVPAANTARIALRADPADSMLETRDTSGVSVLDTRRLTFTVPGISVLTNPLDPFEAILVAAPGGGVPPGPPYTVLHTNGAGIVLWAGYPTICGLQVGVSTLVAQCTGEVAWTHSGAGTTILRASQFTGDPVILIWPDEEPQVNRPLSIESWDAGTRQGQLFWGHGADYTVLWTGPGEFVEWTSDPQVHGITLGTPGMLGYADFRSAAGSGTIISQCSPVEGGGYILCLPKKKPAPGQFLQVAEQIGAATYQTCWGDALTDLFCDGPWLVAEKGGITCDGLDIAGTRALFPCCCGQDVAGCCGCAASPENWQVTVQGVLSGVCDCSNQFNGTFLLKFRTQVSDICTWSTDATFVCFPEDQGAKYRLYCNATDWVLESAPCCTATGECITDGPVKYKKSRASWACLGDNVMTYESNTGKCCASGSWPATVTVSPA